MKALPGDVTVYETLRELHRVEFPKPKWLVEHLLPGAGLTVLAGEVRIGKSCLAIQIARGLVTGEAVLDRPVTTIPRVMVVQADCTPEEWQDQTRNIAGPLDQIATVFLPRYWLGRPEAVRSITQAITVLQPGLIVYDSLNSCASLDHDLNTRAGMLQTVEGILRLNGERPGLLLHHLNKDHEKSGVARIAGSHALVAACSGILQLSRIGCLGTLRIASRYRLPPGLETVDMRQDPNTGAWKVIVPGLPPPGSPWP